MENITVLGLLKKYKEWVLKGDIKFIKKDSKEKEVILNQLSDLIKQFTSAEDKAKEEKSTTGKKGNLSEHIDWYNVHTKGIKLWEKLANCALKDIENDSKGNSRLFDFLTAATEFEDLLYGLEPYYRDHTLHCLWVYFLGEHLLRDLLPNINNGLNWYLYNDIEKDKESYSEKLIKDSLLREKEIKTNVDKHKEAIWCIMALCHDLGYSLAKLEKLNDKVKNVLKFFDLPNIRHVGYSLDIEHQYILSQFLELMAMDVRIVPHTNEKEAVIKGYREDSTYWRLCRALEKKEHGILSSYLIYKILSIFADAWMRGSSEEWGLEDDEAVDNIIRGNILFGIAQHEFEFAHLSTLCSLADVLILADELEEFSRYGRQLLSRKYYDTTAETRINFNPKKIKQGDEVDINIVYEVAEHLEGKNFYGFFIRKAEKLCKLYSLDQEYDFMQKKSCTIRSLKMEMVKGKDKMAICLSRRKDTVGNLLESPLKERKYPAGKYKLSYDEDKLYVYVNDEKISLKEWFDINEA